MSAPTLAELGWDDAWARQVADPGLLPARVALQGPGSWRVFDGTGERHVHRAGVDVEAPPPVTGDWVLVRPVGEDQGVIGQLLPRRTAMSRKKAGQRTVEQTIAANVDVVGICTPADDVNPRRLERELAAAWTSGATPLVVVTKGDLVDDPASSRAEAAAVALGVEVAMTSALWPDGAVSVRAHLGVGRTLVLLGPSGVGKSTLVNQLLDDDVQDVREIRADGRGRHTTTSRHLIPVPTGGVLLDTPGMREFAPWVDAGLQDVFADIVDWAADCRFADCSHTQEPDCAVLYAVETGEVSEDRFTSWQGLQREQAWLARKRDARLRAQDAKRFGRVMREARARSRP